MQPIDSHLYPPASLCLWTTCKFCIFDVAFNICLFTGRFTKIPANITAKVGQNIEMECAFQSETASVYLEIQWWFIRAPEEPSEIEEETATEVL